MADFRTEIRARVDRLRSSLDSARETGDDYLVEVLLGDLESMARIAAEHQVSLDGAEESLAVQGVATSAVAIGPANPE